MPGFWARPGSRSPKTWHICSFLPCTTATARPHVPEWGEPRRDRPRPQSKTPFSRKEFITPFLALIFQCLPAPFSSLHPMNGETKCARFLGSSGPAGPENLAHLLLPSLHHRNGKTNVPECGQPRDRPRPESKTPLSRKEFITQNLALIFQFLPAPSSSLHPMTGETKCARFLGLPRPAEPENLAHLLLPSLHHSNGKNGKATCVGMGGTPRSAPTLSKTPFSRKDFITQNLALVFQFLPAPFSSLHPMNGETKCARLLGSPGPAEPENLAHLLLPSLHHSNGKATCAGMRGTPRSAPTPIKNAFFTKRVYHSRSGPGFQFLPAPSSSLHPMNGETKCARFLGSPGFAEPENLAHLLFPSFDYDYDDDDY